MLNETLEEEIADKAPDMVILRTGKPHIAHEILQVVKGFRKEGPLPVLIMAAGDLLRPPDEDLRPPFLLFPISPLLSPPITLVMTVGYRDINFLLSAGVSSKRPPRGGDNGRRGAERQQGPGRG